ncbi:DUF3347 domain-containing protein [Danxiaibacter flavus]|uniref:DUF3347 domain-containing protein n=1 Tax=Danxiaibacter flavus TaxID=3049108 RepID=A0ABV3ZAP3_9BACT|nr:DUF3347 domain-containing protein [Chitinophagaceae bacterium DXS]
MKKGLLIIGLAVAVVAVYLLFFNKSDDKKDDVKQQPLAISKNDDAFNKPFNEFLNGYYTLSNAFVEWDSTGVDKAANELIQLAGKVPYEKIKADSSIVSTGKSFSDNVIAESKGIVGEPTLEGKRRSFYTLSENLYNLIRTVQYDQQVIYHFKCPMAFNDNEEAFWISNNSAVTNPYLGKKHPKYKGSMISCGNVTDSIDFRQK